MQKYIDFYQNLFLGEEEDVDCFWVFYDEYLVVLDMLVEFYLEIIEWVFKNNEVVCGVIIYKG